MEAFSKTLFLNELKKLNASTDRQIIIHKIVDSTSTDLMRRVRIGSAGAGAVVITDIQTAGRGRRGNTWISSDPDSLYISLAVTVTGKPSKTLPMVPLSAGIAAVYALQDQKFTKARLKWPNDVLVNDKKLGGILCETPNLQAKPLLAIVGLGLNLGTCDLPADTAGNAVSMASLAKSVIKKETIAAAWISKMDQRSTNIAQIVDKWQRCAEPFGRRVKIGDITATTLGLNNLGQLLIKKDDGDVISIPGGIVENLI